MPYLRQTIRNEIDNKSMYPESAGDLNYKIHTVIGDYVRDNGESYATYNEIIGALECIKMELYRRGVSEYEDKKILENGDIGFYQRLHNETGYLKKD